MTGALQGVVVVALEQAVAAPLATSRLADAGARVIKLERPEGDFSRGYDDFVNGLSSYFVWNNRGKESCVIDLRNPGDLDLLDNMLAGADIFVQNLAPGATDRLGIGSKTLRERHPRLIVCDIGGFASGTPDQERKAYDLLMQAEAGLAGVTGGATSGPSRVGVSICDISTGQAAYAAILEALIRRSGTGHGAHIQISLFDTIAEFMNVPYLARRYGGKEPKRLGLAHPSIAPYGVFRTADGEMVLSIQNDREWEVFSASVIGRPGLAHDARFSRNVDRVKNREALDDIVQQAIGTFSTEELSTLLDKVRIAYGRISSMDDLIRHRSVTMTSVATPNGSVELLASPVLFDGERAAGGRVPALGEHSATLRHEFGQKAVSGAARGKMA
jgi:crotonobetainyl-CoA:carnitine CoA-transferase CaiB-like acyl-CoA transferase